MNNNNKTEQKKEKRKDIIKNQKVGLTIETNVRI